MLDASQPQQRRLRMCTAYFEDSHFKLSPFCAQNTIADDKSRQHFDETLQRRDRTEKFVREQGSLRLCSQLSSNKSASHLWPVWVSLVCHNTPDGHSCCVSALCFCSADLLAESDLCHPTNLFHRPACTSSPGSCAPVWSSNSSAHWVAAFSLRSKTGSLGERPPTQRSNHHPTSAMSWYSKHFVHKLGYVCRSRLGYYSLHHHVSVKGWSTDV